MEDITVTKEQHDFLTNVQETMEKANKYIKHLESQLEDQQKETKRLNDDLAEEIRQHNNLKRASNSLYISLRLCHATFSATSDTEYQYVDKKAQKGVHDEITKVLDNYDYLTK